MNEAAAKDAAEPQQVGEAALKVEAPLNQSESIDRIMHLMKTTLTVASKQAIVNVSIGAWESFSPHV